MNDAMIAQMGSQAQTFDLVIQPDLPSDPFIDAANEEAYERQPEPPDPSGPDSDLIYACQQVIDAFENGEDMKLSVSWCRSAILLAESRRLLAESM